MAEIEPDFYSSYELLVHPKPYFDRLRAKCPVTPEPYYNSLMVTGYDAAMDVLNRKDGTFSTLTQIVGPKLGLPFEPEGEDITAQVEAHRSEFPWSSHLVCYDGDFHQKVRAIISNLLTYKRLKANEDYLNGLADMLIDGFIDKGSCDVVSAYANPTSTYAICDILGVPEAHRAELLALIGPTPSQLEGDGLKVGPDPLMFLKDRFDEYIRERQEKPAGDMMSDIANSKFKDGSTPDPDVLSHLARFAYGAGQDTTARLIAMAILILAEDKVLQTRLRENPNDIPDFIEEVLRYDAPVKSAYRLTLKSTEVAGVPVPAGTILNVLLMAASNDPAHFEHPERFDMDRPGNRDHFGFNKGAHACPAAALGRMEARVCIERILARTSDIRICEEHHGPTDDRSYRFEPTYSYRSLADLHIEFDSA